MTSYEKVYRFLSAVGFSFRNPIYVLNPLMIVTCNFNWSKQSPPKYGQWSVFIFRKPLAIFLSYKCKRTLDWSFRVWLSPLNQYLYKCPKGKCSETCPNWTLNKIESSYNFQEKPNWKVPKWAEFKNLNLLIIFLME